MGKRVNCFTKNDVTFDINLFLYGFPDTNMTKVIFKRTWGISCIAKFAIWKSRCLHVFETKVQTQWDNPVYIIKNEIKVSVETDFKRLRFYKGNSSVRTKRGKLLLICNILYFSPLIVNTCFYYDLLLHYCIHILNIQQ